MGRTGPGKGGARDQQLEVGKALSIGITVPASAARFPENRENNREFLKI
jgi:hypothetical protein